MGKIAAGDRFPPVALPDPEGQMRVLSHGWAGGPALFALAHGDCPTSRLALPYVDRLHRRRSPDTAVVAILQESPASARELARELDLGLPVVLDQDPYVTAEQLGLETVPTLVHVDRSGHVVRVVEGFSRDELEELAATFGVAGPLIAAEEQAPRLRPG